MEYDTTLAKDFLKQHTKFMGINSEGDESRKVINSIGQEIFLSNPSKKSVKYIDDIAVKKRKLLNLSQLIKKNEELFCQLEYLIRKIQPDEIKTFDFQLIVQNIIYCSSERYQPTNQGSVSNLHMKDDSLLVRLALFAQKILETSGNVNIVSEKETAVVSWLFVHLCEEAGFGDQVSLYFTESITGQDIQEYHLDLLEREGGCIAVVTSKSDIDSAVDALIESSDRNPWRVKRVLVQENVLERFRVGLEDKAKRSPADIDEALSRKSTSAFQFNKKIFLFEYAGDCPNSNAIMVEAYRTVKELISLLKNFKPYALSVWCDSVSESNEIAHNVSPSIIWVNAYGEFCGPPVVSQTLLSEIPKAKNIYVPDSFKKVRSSWNSLYISERAAILRDLLNEHKLTDVNNSFYSVTKNFTCAGIEKAAGTVVLGTQYSVPQLLIYIVKGGSIVFDKDCAIQDLNSLYEGLKNAGAPVAVTDRSQPDNEKVYVDIAYIHKHMWTSYGTIFAN